MFESIIALVSGIAPVLQQGSTAPAIPEASAALIAKGLAALGVGIAALGSGVAERGIGAAAVGAIAEDEDFFGIGLLMTVIPESLVILAIVVIFLI